MENENKRAKKRNIHKAHFTIVQMFRAFGSCAARISASVGELEILTRQRPKSERERRNGNEMLVKIILHVNDKERKMN